MDVDKNIFTNSLMNFIKLNIIFKAPRPANEATDERHFKNRSTKLSTSLTLDVHTFMQLRWSFFVY